MNKKTIILIILVLGVIGFGIYTGQTNKIDLSKYDKNQLIKKTADNGQFGDLIIGEADAKVTVVEYGDYQCPACGKYSYIFDQLPEKYSNQVKVIFRQYPIPSHPDAKAAAAVALAAAKQDKFEQIHHKLFNEQDRWVNKNEQRTQIFEQMAEELELDIKQFKKDVIDESINKKINFDMKLGREHKLTATPTIIIDGKSIDPEVWSNQQKLDKTIKQAIKKAYKK